MLFLWPMGVRKAQDAATATPMRKGIGIHREALGHGDADRGGHQRRGHVVEHIRKRHCDRSSG